MFCKIYLQQEPWTFWHERECYHRADTGQCTDDHKYSPAVKLIGRSHTETPSYKRRKAGMKQNKEYYVHVIVWNFQVVGNRSTPKVGLFDFFSFHKYSRHQVLFS